MVHSQRPNQTKRHIGVRVYRVLLMGAFLLLITWLAIASQPQPLIPGPDTTVFSEPLNDDGTVDYIGVLNEKWSEGVTPENNAAILLMQLVDPNDVTADPVEYARVIQSEWPEESVYKSIEVVVTNEDDLAEALLQLREPETTKTAWTAEDHPEVATWLISNKPALDVFRQAGMREQYYEPLVPIPSERQLLHAKAGIALQMRRLSQLALADTMLALGQDDTTRTIENLNALHRIGRLVSQKAFVAATTVADDVQVSAMWSETMLLKSQKLNLQQLAARREFFERLPDRGSKADVIASERLVALDAAQAELREEWKKTLSRKSDPNLVLKLITTNYELALDALSETNYEAQQHALDQFEVEVQKTRPPKSNSLVTQIFESKEILARRKAWETFDIFYPVAKSTSDIEWQMQAMDVVFIATIAVEQHRATHGTYPETLTKLDPEFSDCELVDPFGHPLVYKVSQETDSYHLYSTGPNGQDNGGRFYPGRLEDDIATCKPSGQ